MKGTLRVLRKPISLDALESRLKASGYSKVICGSRGWNHITGAHQDIAVGFLMERDWSDLLQ